MEYVICLPEADDQIIHVRADDPPVAQVNPISDRLTAKPFGVGSTGREKRRPCSNRGGRVGTYLPRAAGRAVFVKLSEDRVPEPRGHSLSSVWSSSRHTGASGE